MKHSVYTEKQLLGVAKMYVYVDLQDKQDKK